MQAQPAYNQPQPYVVTTPPTAGTVAYPTYPGQYPPGVNQGGPYLMQSMQGPQQVLQQWVPQAQGNVPNGTPPGLEYLAVLDQVIIHQKLRMMEFYTGWEQENRYSICNNIGQQIWYAREQADACCRQCCHEHRGFNMTMEDANKQVIWSLEKEYHCTWCPCVCKQQGAAACICCCTCGWSVPELNVQCPTGNIVATIKQKRTCCGFNFGIWDRDNNQILKIIAPSCIWGYGTDFSILYKGGAREGELAGTIRRQFGMMQWIADVDNFSVTFPMDMHPTLKACLIGATILLDYAFFLDQHGQMMQT